jgi:hypothetical protein
VFGRCGDRQYRIAAGDSFGARGQVDSRVVSAARYVFNGEHVCRVTHERACTGEVLSGSRSRLAQVWGVQPPLEEEEDEEDGDARPEA